jgi:hypothetical protein
MRFFLVAFIMRGHPGILVQFELRLHLSNNLFEPENLAFLRLNFLPQLNTLLRVSLLDKRGKLRTVMISLRKKVLVLGGRLELFDRGEVRVVDKRFESRRGI